MTIDVRTKLDQLLSKLGALATAGTGLRTRAQTRRELRAGLPPVTESEIQEHERRRARARANLQRFFRKDGT